MRLSFVDPHFPRSTLSLQKEQTAYKSLRSKCFAVINFGMGLFDLQRKLLIFLPTKCCPKYKTKSFLILLARSLHRFITTCKWTFAHVVYANVDGTSEFVHKTWTKQVRWTFWECKDDKFFLVEGNASCISVIIVELKKKFAAFHLWRRAKYL